MRAAAGITEETVTAGTLAAVLAEARSRHADSPRFEAVLGICSVIVDGTPVGRRDHHQVLVGDGSVVELLPPFAGGRV